MRCLTAMMFLCIMPEEALLAQRAVLPLTNAQKLALVSPQRLAVVFGNGRLLMMDTQGNPLYQTQLTERGTPTCMEIAEGGKLMLFYRERQEVVVMDWKLAILATFHLPTLNQGFIEGLCAGAGSTIWILPSAEYRLERYSYQWQKELESPVVSMLAEATLQNMCMEEGNGKVAVPVGNELLLFDQNGTPAQTLTIEEPFDGIAGITEEGVWLWVSSPPRLIIADWQGTTRRIELPGYPAGSPIVDVTVEYGLAVVASPQAIFLYNVGELLR